MFLTRKILTRRGETENRTPQNGESGNDGSHVEHHHQSENPRHQHKPNEKCHRSAEHESHRNPQKQRREPCRRYLSQRRRSPGRRVRHERRRAEEVEDQSRQLAENPRLLILLSSHGVHF